MPAKTSRYTKAVTRNSTRASAKGREPLSRDLASEVDADIVVGACEVVIARVVAIGLVVVAEVAVKDVDTTPKLPVAEEI